LVSLSGSRSAGYRTCPIDEELVQPEPGKKSGRVALISLTDWASPQPAHPSAASLRTCVRRTTWLL
jgi:hypothetical protein